MVNQKVTVINKSGIHARPASVLVNVAKKCDSDVKFLYGEKTINPKSILMLMTAGLTKGTEFTIQCEGQTEEEDLKLLVDAIESGLGE